MIRQLDFYGYPYVGIYGTNTEQYVVLPPDVAEQAAEAVCETLGVTAIRTLINESTLIGSMMTGNSNGFIVSDLALDKEMKVLQKHTKASCLIIGFSPCSLRLPAQSRRPQS